MELLLFRTYYPKGVNGELWCGGQLVCHTVELPWQMNKRGVSCIPEGEYKLQKHFVDEKAWYLQLQDVPNRKYILLHPANDANVQLRGCIAPVTKLVRPGVGNYSRKAVKKLNGLVSLAFDKGQVVTIKISTKPLNNN